MTEFSSVQTIEELTALYPSPGPTSRGKVQDRLSPLMQRWLTQSPFFVLSSVSAGGVDCSPRGDTPDQAFRVLDNKTIAIPDRTGNNRIDTLRNILNDPRVGLVFFVPGIDDAVRIKGTARISTDKQLLASFTLEGSPPVTVLLISISAVYVQNGRAQRRAGMWNSDTQKNKHDLPSAAELSKPAA